MKKPGKNLIDDLQHKFRTAQKHETNEAIVSVGNVKVPSNLIFAPPRLNNVDSQNLQKTKVYLLKNRDRIKSIF